MLLNFVVKTEYHNLCDKIGTQESKWGIKPIHRHAVTRRPINSKCFEKYAVNEVLRKIAFCDRTWDSIFGLTCDRICDSKIGGTCDRACDSYFCALWDRTCDSVFSYVVIEVVILLLGLPVIVFVIEIGIEVVTDNL